MNERKEPATTGKRNTVRLQMPVTDAALSELQQGDVVYLDGVVYTGREGVYKRCVDEGVAPPVDFAALSNVNFHCSPAAAVKPDGSYDVGAVTATASFRFARWMARWFEISGAKVILGKGGMSEEIYKEVFVPRGARYLTTVGYGTGALLGRGIKKTLGAYWIEELGLAQALWVFEVEKFGPFLVDSGADGSSLFEQSNRAVNARIESLYAGLKPPALGRYGETSSREDEVI